MTIKNNDRVTIAATLVCLTILLPATIIPLDVYGIVEDDGWVEGDDDSRGEISNQDELEEAYEGSQWEEDIGPNEFEEATNNDDDNNDDDNNDDENKIDNNGNSKSISSSSNSSTTKTIVVSPNVAATTQTVSFEEQSLTYDNPDYNISIQYPSDWAPSEVGLAPYQAVKLVAPTVEEQETPTSIVVYTPATVGVAVRPLDSNNMTKDQFIEQFFETTYTSPSQYRIIQRSNATLAGTEADRIIMYEYPEGGSTSKVMRVITVQNGTAYWIKYAAEPGKYDEYLPIAQTMIDSFSTSSDINTSESLESNVISSLQQSDSLSVPGRESSSKPINYTMDKISPGNDIVLQPRPGREEISSLPSKLIVTDVSKGESQLPLRYSTTSSGLSTEKHSSGATTGELHDYYPVVMFHFDQPSQLGLVNIKHLLLGPIKNYGSPNDILSDSRYFKDVPLNEQVLLEMDSTGSNYLIASVQFANGSQGVYSNIMDMDSIFTKGTSEDQVDYRMDNGEEYNILDNSDVNDIQLDPSFQQIASKIICSDLDSNGFQVCRQGLSTNSATTGTSGGGDDQITVPSLSPDGDSDDDDDDDKDGNGNDNNDNNDDDD